MSIVTGIKQRRIQAAIEAAERWSLRASQRTQTARTAAMGAPLDTPDRREQYVLRERRRDGERRFIERVLGPTKDFVPYPPDEAARFAGRPVARIVAQWDTRFEPEGFATGFMVSPRLLLTNYHVFPKGEDPGPCFAQFFYERVSNGVNKGVMHRIDTKRFYLSDKSLDFALVAVVEDEAASVRLAEIGYTRMVAATGKVLIGHPINIIQHPSGLPKQYATTENKLLDVLEAGFLHYTTDTLQGSSGSPVFNHAWELVALHHSSVPRMVDGKILTKASTQWNDSMSEEDIDWIANEGTRVSSIVRHIQSLPPLEDGEQEALRGDFLTRVASAESPSSQESSLIVLPQSSSAQDPSHSRSIPVADSLPNASIVIQVNPVINVHGAQRGPSEAPRPAIPALPQPSSDLKQPPELALERAIRFDRNYNRKSGYSAKFLDGYEIPLPKVAAERMGEMWCENADGNPTILHYHHYSLAMNATRRTCMWTAVNVDYTPSKRSKLGRSGFGRDKWIEDPRVPLELQITDEEFYKPATKVDRGHIVRREDNCWGNTPLEIEYANSDTFHWTNCTIQHQAFNQESKNGIWGRFESFITQQIGAVDNKATIFAGPILAEDDPDYDYGFGPIQYPLRFWKVVATVSSANRNKLFVTGFVFSQADVVEEEGLEQINFAPWKKNRKTLAAITKLTGVEFSRIMLDADIL